MILTCQGDKVPIIETGNPKEIIDLDDPKFNNIFQTDEKKVNFKRSDCFIVYESGETAIMERKQKYTEYGKFQLENTAKILNQKWDEFLQISGLDKNTSRPTHYYIYAENGLGHSRFIIDSNNNLRERSTKGENKGPIQTIFGVNIKVYSKKDIDNMYRFR
ncbi:MAG: hypothetical protein ACP5G1_04410 [Nanopusillaceae archaeon]